MSLILLEGTISLKPSAQPQRYTTLELVGSGKSFTQSLNLCSNGELKSSVGLSLFFFFSSRVIYAIIGFSFPADVLS